MVPARKNKWWEVLYWTPKVLPKDLIVLTIRWCIIKSQDIQGAKGSINTYINNIIIVIYADLLTTSKVIIANEIN